jgi:hypothetical protein
MYRKSSGKWPCRVCKKGVGYLHVVYLLLCLVDPHRGTILK